MTAEAKVIPLPVLTRKIEDTFDEHGLEFLIIKDIEPTIECQKIDVTSFGDPRPRLSIGRAKTGVVLKLELQPGYFLE